MAASLTVIGRTTRVRGRVSGDGDFQIEGLVVGEIVTSGNVTIDAHGMVGANVRGRRLVVRGAVQGDLLGEEAVVLEDGARVVGDVRAPRVAIASGALMRGEVQTADEGGSRQTAVRSQAVAKPVVAPARVASPPAKPAPAVAPAAPKAAAPAVRSAPAPAAAASAPARRPPPPIVPVLRKAKGQMLKKKER
jgi:cytoskeletal protein CcmA (bactofilin family)